ncbi:branched-chain amino acid ABC transporter permease [Bosea sp. (in: a-proteobacteria)]|uniref:branched-chain amino acid ABC transporter permease n=1 Tax=Bosea sp. (in: a-proteobacteria) TaxID=1871050 RepID=UPI002606E165|nr:branched-chain amino acid ABC transporter permease [Bosea sp. (in: a-proteobacteria)]MCO5091226.1 branched-chain amino acid ABC transporter permease [Bosea sp. (in: a-proteobacteria)]
MSGFFYASQVLLDLVLLNCGFALAQYVVQRAGVFSVATAGVASIGAYAAAIAVTRAGLPGTAAIAIAGLAGLIVSALLSIPLARLRGAYQAIATIAFVQIVMAVMFYAESWTGGSVGIKDIPKLVGSWHLLLAVAVTLYMVHCLDRSGVGRAFNAIRQDEVVAVTLGISVVKYHIIAFAISGTIGGFFGGMQALYFYSIEPAMFGFAMAIAILTYVIFGGQNSVIGPIVGTVILTLVPEIARPLADSRMLVFGILLVISTIFLPDGFVDSLGSLLRRRRTARREAAKEGAN